MFNFLYVVFMLAILASMCFSTFTRTGRRPYAYAGFTFLAAIAATMAASA